MQRQVRPKVKDTGPRQNQKRNQGGTTRRSPEQTVPTHKAAKRRGKSRLGGLEGELKVVCVHVPEIPMYNGMPIRTVKRQWRFNAAFANDGFEIIDGHRQFGVIVGTGATNVRSYADLWRIKKILVFAHATDDEETSTFRITPVGSDSNDNFLNDLPQIFTVKSADQSGYNLMVLTPSLDHPMGMWHNTSAINPNAPLFLMSANLADSNSILQIEFEYIENYSGIPNGFVETSSVISLGELGGWSLFGGNCVLDGINSLG